MKHAKRSYAALLPIVAALLTSACTAAIAGGPAAGDYGYGGGPPGGHGGYYGPANLHIPPGHLPPPGSCRIWYPGEPPGHQPPPGPCGELSYHVPPGAWLIARPPHEPGRVHVDFYDEARAGVVLGVSIYDADTGRRIGSRRPKHRKGEAGKTRPH